MSNAPLRNTHQSPHARDLAAFVAVVEDGGYAGAARRLDLAPSTLSRAVAKLETLLGVTLLRRTTRSIALTDEGREVLERARLILDGFEGLHGVGDAARAPRGDVRISAAVPFVLHVIAPCMAAFRERYPDIEVTLTMTDSVVNLVESHVDAAIRLGELPDSELLQRRLGASRWRLVASPAYLERVGVPRSIDDLAHLEQVRFVFPRHLNDWRFRGSKTALRLPAAAHADNGEAVRRLVLHGLGAARFSDFMVDDDIDAGRLIELLPGQLDEPPLPITAVYLDPLAESHRLDAFVSFVAEALNARFDRAGQTRPSSSG